MLRCSLYQKAASITPDCADGGSSWLPGRRWSMSETYLI